MSRLKQRFYQHIVPELKKILKVDNSLAVPVVKKIVVNAGVTDTEHRGQAIKSVADQLTAITGQHPSIRLARQSIAGFKLRAGDPVGVSVTLRGERMYHFLDKLISIVLPRVKDFQGLPVKAFDGRGNYNLGLTEQIIFPEINYDKIDTVRGLQITIVTNCINDQQGKELLTLLGLPFEKIDQQ